MDSGRRSSRTDEAELQAVAERARAGNHEAFADLYRNYYRRVFALCRHLLGSVEAAEDASSEVFLRIQRAMRAYDSARPFPSWLLGIASHYCVDLLRRRQVEGRLFEPGEVDVSDPAIPETAPLSELLANEQRAAVRAAVAALPDRLRLPLVLRYDNELSYQQIAEMLGLNRNLVATLIFRAKRELRRVLAAYKEKIR